MAEINGANLSAINVTQQLQKKAMDIAKGAAAPPAAAAAEPPQEQLADILADLLTLLVDQGVSDKANFQATQNIQAKASGVGNAGNASAPAGAAPAAHGGRLKIAQIDNFSTDSSGFNHGNEIAKTLKAGGNVDLLQFDAKGSSGNVAGALSQVLQKVKNGEQIDAVNISMADFKASGDTQQAKQLMSELKALGVPVVVAAGNNGPGQVNQLGGNDAFVVQSTSNGRVNGDSGRGNVQAEGRTTSFATANLAVQLAQMKADGLSVDQIKAQT